MTACTFPSTKDQVKDAPNVDVDSGHLDPSEERRLYEHYGMTYSERASNSGLPDGGTDLTTGTPGTTGTTDTFTGEGHHTSGPNTDDDLLAPRSASTSAPRRRRQAAPGCGSTSPPSRRR